ncbi:hypothetical protein M7I_6261 [Glarea lozoyensis 74030]|uniref:Uncharacterized protein n=1 Tax=Glarea lozoyensis (strain ATCC 74030 / MF5533) TaxID=1104152 RepID=H0EU32_GLAL7|nr:hypothetical protein M7I_6261 [Glarea lozoyensis 74030]
MDFEGCVAQCAEGRRGINLIIAHAHSPKLELPKLFTSK